MKNTSSSWGSSDSYLEDANRLATLASTGLMDSIEDKCFDRLTRLAASIVAAPVATLSLVDADRQYFKSSFGLAEPLSVIRQTPLSHSFCKHVVNGRGTLVIGDARHEPSVKDNPAIREFGVIAYLGVPLIVDGHVIGAFCVIDGTPRDWTSAEIRILTDLAELVVAEILLQRIESQEAEHVLDSRRGRQPFLSKLAYAVIAIDEDGDIVFLNKAAEDLLGSTAASVRGRPARDVLSKANGLTRRPGERPLSRVPLLSALRLGAMLCRRLADSLRSRRSAYSLADASRSIGVTKHTIETWERRYGFPVATRSFLGGRRYSADQVAVLSRIVELASSGRTIGEMIRDHQLGILVI